MANSPLVSAIITTHNRPLLLNRAIKSVLSQTYKNIECIVVDDKSDDNTKDICASFPTIRYIYISPEESKGGNYARNQGIIASKGRYCAFLDDDDYWLPQKIEKQVQLIKEKGCELVYCGRKMEIVHKERTSFYSKLPNPSFGGDMHKKILMNICCTTSTMMVSREALFGAGLFDEKLAFWQEYELTIRLAQRKPFFYVNEPLCVYRKDVNDKQRLTNKYWGWKKAVKYIHQKHRGLYKRLTIKEKIKAKVLVWEDAYFNRCNSSGLRWRKRYYRLLIIIFSSIPKKLGKGFR
jgi:glycosyltransferase involved in cell wall biosynthesis